MQLFIVAAAFLAVSYAKPVFIYTQPLHPVGVEYAPTAVPQVQPHPAVELNAASEALLPRELLKSNAFYDNPSIAAGLAKESWFTNKEMQVVEREAEKIPREKIYNIVKSAGFLDQH
ncbi:uncharacterized protein LOC126380597 [Pectinophora gossypiella]|uniref:uncharacterized protein LOC126380597 n=1 Tax=Pectinophora gossypiella TaxID=13191 RepID=UPI00214E4689|nr:uncharacterized protein LOC126380597 [Pectinophora gossypiella]XP_049886085.1 uncharacterized protein LOC126380597 [Pectinophora gossypiella]XP_049886086.1 uncharacterized protein LOC126380597 [Pectinophora gossypiella]